MGTALKGGDQHRVTNIIRSTPLDVFVEMAAAKGLRVMVTAPNRRGQQHVILIDPELIKVHRQDDSAGQAVPSTLGEVACYQLKGGMVLPGKPVPSFDI
jgi:hypothetical protein